MMDDFEKFENTGHVLSRLQGGVNGALRMHKSPNFNDYAPDDLKEKVDEFLKFIDDYDTDKLRPGAKELTGDMFDTEGIDNKIQEATGYVWKPREWEQEEIKEDGSYTPENIEHSWGVKPSAVRVIEFYRAAKNRGELWLLQLVVMPGCAFISWDSGRAAGDTEIHNSHESLIKELKGV